MKYYILSRAKNPGMLAGKHYWYLDYVYNSFEEVNNLLDKSNPFSEYLVIKGSELKWEIETEEVVKTEIIEKSRKLKDVP